MVVRSVDWQPKVGDIIIDVIIKDRDPSGDSSSDGNGDQDEGRTSRQTGHPEDDLEKGREAIELMTSENEALKEIKAVTPYVYDPGAKFPR